MGGNAVAVQIVRRANMPLDTYLPWLRHLEAKGGKGVVLADARSLGRAADEIEFLRSLLAPVAQCCAECGRPNEPGNRALWRILAEVAAAHGLPVHALKVDDRRRLLVNARWHYFYRACCETVASLQTIGDVCGGRDHTSVGYGASMYAMANKLEPARGKGLDAKTKLQRTLETGRKRDADRKLRRAA